MTSYLDYMHFKAARILKLVLNSAEYGLECAIDANNFPIIFRSH